MQGFNSFGSEPKVIVGFCNNLRYTFNKMVELSKK